MISSDLSAKICKHCKHAMKEPSFYVCTKAIDIVTGYSPACDNVRATEAMCGETGKWHERRMNASAIVDQTPVYGYSKDGGKTYLGTLGDGAQGNERLGNAQPIDQNEHVKAYHPKDVNLEEWKRDDQQ